MSNMRLLPYKNFSLTYIEYRESYISNYGRDKFNKAFDAVINHEKTISLLRASKEKRVAPKGSEFCGLIFLMSYFIFAKNDTRAIGAIIALYLWNEKINNELRIADEKHLGWTIEEIFGFLRI